jgi:glycosyltransferase involved in cell wall biosynthesis
VHAFTPREHVRRLTEAVAARDGCPYVVHLEDNEEAILADMVGADAVARIGERPAGESDALVGPRLTHPVRAPAFLEGAAGVTAVIDTLLERVPRSLPAAVVWPGFDPAVLHLPQDVKRLRSRLRLKPEHLVLAYTGNIHESNLEEVRALYLAVAALRDGGLPLTLVKTGWNNVDMRWARKLRRGIRDLGFVSRARLWEVLAIADGFVQPGGPGPFNDLRFPSKLPDYLATGKPVVLPATNIGRYLEDGVQALLLQRGDAEEIAAAVTRLVSEPTLGREIGRAGREFALEHLRWERNVDPLLGVYAAVVEASRAPGGGTASRAV